VTSRDITRVILNEEQRTTTTTTTMPKTKQQRWQNLLRLQDLSVGMFVEVNSGDPKNPWFGEIFQLYAKKKKKKGDRRDERDDPYFEPVGVKWIARVQGAKEKLYEYKGGSHRIWLESIVKCGHDLDCGVYLKRGGKGPAKEAAAKKPTTSSTPVASPKKSSGNNKNALALVVRKTTPTKKKTTLTKKDDNKKNGIKAKEAEKKKRDVEKQKLARERERLKKEKSRLVTANREVQRKLNLVEKDLVRVAAGKMPLKKKKKPVAPLVVRTKSASVSKKNQSPKKTGAGGAVRRDLSHVTRRIRASTPTTTKTTKNTQASSSPSTKQQKNNNNKTTLTVARKTAPTLQPPAALFGNLSSSSDSEEF
jgi:hypothetical protein